MALAITGMTIASCKKSNDMIVSDTQGLLKTQEMSDGNYTVEIYTATGTFQLGYNNIYLRLKENSTGAFIEDANFTWSPIMQMTSSSHSCPKSAITKVTGKQTLYNGFLVFQMPENSDEHWNLSITYQTGSVAGTVTGQITVPPSLYRRVAVFTGTDSKKYIVALIQPQKPTVALNDLVIGLFSMESMMMFPSVAGYQIHFDPRMPDMGNHSSPNNVDPVYSDVDQWYHGKVSLTMTGKWQLNLIVKNNSGVVLAGQEVSGSTGSTLYLELEAN